MQVEKITPKSIKKAVKILKHGGTVVYPTETAYALGCDATSAVAKQKIFKIKNRPKEKSLPVICSSKTQVQKFFKLPTLAWKIWKKYWPKPVSIILVLSINPVKLLRRSTAFGRFNRVKYQVSREAPVRISSNKIARDLARGLGRPIVSTSANISGEPAMYDAKEIASVFSRKKNQPDLILDSGRLEKKPASTIIKIIGEKIEVLRQGEAKIITN